MLPFGRYPKIQTWRIGMSAQVASSKIRRVRCGGPRHFDNLPRSSDFKAEAAAAVATDRFIVSYGFYRFLWVKLAYFFFHA
jgi:hypothetical protein